MADMHKTRWLTLIGDSVLTNLKGKKGFQIVIGSEFEVSDFVQSITCGDLIIKSEQVAIMIGADIVKTVPRVNLGRRLETLIRKIRSKNSDTKFWVSSVLPRPDKDVEFDDMIQHTNTTISAMCRRLDKYKDIEVTYVPLHQD